MMSRTTNSTTTTARMSPPSTHGRARNQRMSRSIHTASRIVGRLQPPLPDQATAAVQPDLGGDGRVGDDGAGHGDDRRPHAPAVVHRHEDRGGPVAEEHESVDESGDRHEQRGGAEGARDERRDQQRPGDRLGDGEGAEEVQGSTEHTFSITERTCGRPGRPYATPPFRSAPHRQARNGAAGAGDEGRSGGVADRRRAATATGRGR